MGNFNCYIPSAVEDTGQLMTSLANNVSYIESSIASSRSATNVRIDAFYSDLSAIRQQLHQLNTTVEALTSEPTVTPDSPPPFIVLFGVFILFLIFMMWPYERRSMEFVPGERLIQILVLTAYVSVGAVLLQFLAVFAVIDLYPLLQSHLALLGLTASASLPNCTNLALRRPAIQSSVFRGGSAGAAVDGNLGALWNGYNLVHTHEHQPGWWEVQLPDACHIRRVDIYNRVDCCAERLDGVVVSFLDATHKPLYIEILRQMREVYSVFAPVDASNVSFVHIETRLYAALNLAEVEVWGHVDEENCQLPEAAHVAVRTE